MKNVLAALCCGACAVILCGCSKSTPSAPKADLEGKMKPPSVKDLSKTAGTAKDDPAAAMGGGAGVPAGGTKAPGMGAPGMVPPKKN
jgi:hypothetical protein